MKKRSTFHRGFTLIEIIVTIVIIGILLSVAVTSIIGSQNRSKKDSAVTAAQQVKLKLATYFQERNRYPATQSDVVTYVGGSTGTTFSNTSIYTYAATTANGSTCSTTSAPKCDTYVITVKKSWWNGSSSDSDVTITP